MKDNTSIISAITATELVTGQDIEKFTVLSKSPVFVNGEINVDEDGVAEFSLVYENTETKEIFTFNYGLIQEGPMQYRLLLQGSPVSQILGVPLVEVTNIPLDVPDTVEELLAEGEEG